MQALYPISAKALPIPLWQGLAMADESTWFDLQLVRDEMKRQGFTQADMAKIAGITSQSAISNIFKGIRQVKVGEAERIYRFLGLAVPKAEPLVQWVPLIGLSGAGSWREAIRDQRESYPLQKGSVGPNAFAVRISGNSMNKVVEDGGVVIVDPDQRQLYDKSVYLIANECGDVTIKQYRSDPARFEPMSTEPAHKPLPIGEEQFTIIGRAVHTVGNLP